ncbi:MAG: hypothetical protein M0011_07695 [Elusimicrobia bacterium]|nr:hypothetical protein [Elusimicrobiota bacterium]
MRTTLALAVLAFALAAPARAGDDWYSAAHADKAAPVVPPPEPATLSLKCSECYGALSPSYSPASPAGLRGLAAEMAAPAGYTRQEARNYFEATGRNLSGAGLDAGEEASKAEKKDLLAAIRKGKYYFGNVIPNVGTGATDCLTHARRLKEYLEERFSPDSYRFEIVNGWSDPYKYSAENLLAANHFMVRAVSMKTGHSYVCDGYVIASVKSEQDSIWILFNDFEDCVYNKYSQMTLGDGFKRTVAMWTPVQKGLLALNGKSGAAVCAAGAEYWTFGK